jgi:hypothetical protein
LGKNKDEIPDDTTPVFTESEIYMIAGYLAERWSVKKKLKKRIKDIDEAIKDVLAYTHGY